MFQPTVLSPVPDPFYVKEIKKIDPNLRVVWGMERYLLPVWAVERKISPERYFRMYRSLIEAGEDRFITQPIYDTNQPIFDAEGGVVAYQKIGERKYDLAPEYEWVMFVEEPNEGGYRPLDMRVVLELKRAYAWDRFHSLTRAKIEKEAEIAAKEKAMDARMDDVMKDAYNDTLRQLGIRVQI